MAGNHMPGSNLMLNINYRSTWFRVLAAMAAIVVFVTTYMLILPAITLEQEPICGTAAHEHTEECYSTTQVLTCSQGEYEGHTHGEACYDEEGNNICGMEEYEGHTHSEACYSEENQLICSVSEHQHTDSCYPEEPVQKEEVSASSENQTTEQPAAEDTPNPADDSQTTALTETQTEAQTDPTIGTICGDPNADLEDEAIWKATFQNVELTGNWSEDILAIAKTQLGYHESTSNYYKESATQNKGITRYGQWYGDRYGDWCAMFVSFCIYYAEVKDYPLSENCADWIRKLSEINLYHPATETVYLTEEDAETYEGTAYVVKPGDLIFFHNGIKPEVASDHVGIVKTVTPYEIVTIEGNASDSVKENTYSTSSTVIVGYGEMTENPNPPVDEEIAVLSEEGTEVLTAEEIETEAAEEIPAETKVQPSVKRTARAAANSGISLMSDGDANGADHDFTNDIHDIYVSVNGNYITPTGGVYQISQNDTVKFDVEYTLPGHTLDNTNTITYHVPTNGLQAQSGYVTGTVNGVAKQAGTYTVAQDGTVTIVFNDEFVTQNQAGNPIDGTIALYETASSIVGNDSDQGNIKFRDDKDYTFQITDRVITNYDLSLTKSQSAVVDGKVTYTIEVSSSKGTDNQQVSLTDTLNKMQINGNVTIQDKNGSTIATLTDKNGQSSFNYYNLPAMNAGDKYTITYQAEAATSETGDMVYGSNTAKAEFTDHDGKKYEPSQTIQTTFDRRVVTKDGYQNGNEIVWTITVNNSHQNIAGWELTDEMMQGMDINVSGGSASDYTYDKTNGKLTFNDNGTNTNTYTITFSTPVTESQYGTGVTNTATLKDKNQNPHTADKQVWVNRPAEVQPVYKTGTKQSDGSILWTITVVGAADVDLANKVLTDDAFKDPTFQLVSVTRNYWNGNYDVTQDYVLDTSAGTLTFNPINGGANTNRYEIKYAVQLTDKTVTLDASNNWKETLTNLPKIRKSGNDVASYTYYFVEQTQAGYEVTYSNGDIALSQGTVIITNKQTDNPEDTDTSVTASKVWKDASGSILEAPTDQNIILDLYQIIDDGEPTRLEDKSITLPDNGSWSKTIENLPLTRIDEENSAVEHQYKYYFVEREVPTGYEVSYTNTAAKPMTSGTETITNTKTTGITVVKQWKDANGNDITGSMGDASVQIQLIQVAGGSTAGRAAVRARAAARSGGGYTVNYGFGHYGASGLVSGTKTCDSGTVMTITITSVNTPTVRTWPDGYNYDWNSTTISPTGDPVDAGNGFQAYTYQITITDNLNIGGITADNDGTVTVSFSGDSSGGESGGGESGGGESGGGEVQPTESVYATATLSAANSWTASFANLPVTGTNASGQNVSYTYYVREISVPNYETTYSNNSGITDGIITVINTGTKRPEYTEVTIEKMWIGSDDEELSPAALVGKSARFKLMTYSGSNKDDATQYGETFTLPDENGNWTKTFNGLPKTTYDASGNAVHWKYYFEEVAAEETTEINYQKESIFSFLPWVNGSEEAADEAIDGGTVTVTNKILPETTTVSVAKEWRDSLGNLLDASQIPANTVITVNLYKITDNQGEPEKVNKDPIELSAENTNNTWRYEEKDLVKKEYVDGEEHTYTYFFSETKMDGYNTEYQSGTSEPVKDETTIPIAEGTFRVINKQVPTTSVTVSKAWFKDTNGTVTNISSEKSGYIEFYLYRVATSTGSTEPDVPTHEHTWDGGVVTTEPGEYTEGVRTYTCTGCGETRTEPIGALGHTHNWTSSVTTAATCSSTGVRTYTCTGCGDSYTETIPVDSGNHTGGTYIDGAYDATETTAGYTGDTKCSGCGATLETGTTTPATGGGEVDPPAGDSYSVTILNQQWGSVTEIETVSVPAGQSLIVTFETTGQVGQMNCGWYKAGDYAYNATSLTCEQLSSRVEQIDDWNSRTWNMMQVVYTPTQDSNLYLNNESDINVNWSLSGASAQSASARMAAPRLMSAPARSASSQTPSIPDGAEIMNGGNTYRLYWNADPAKNWKNTWTFEAEEGYTYTYYVVEVGNENFTTTYEGQGGGNITINNTITETTYSLPHTGGMGTKPITMLGMLLMAAATSLMISKKHRKEENW